MRINKYAYLALFALLATSVFSVRAQNSAQIPEHIDYCDLFNSGKDLKNVTVRTDAYLSYSTVNRVDGGDSFLYSLNCNNIDNFAVLNFTKSLDRKSKQFFTKLPKNQTFVLKVTISGKILSSFIPMYGHLSWSQSKFDVDILSSIENVTGKVVAADHDAEGVRNRLAKHLYLVNSEVVFYFITERTDKAIESLLDHEFVLSDLDGNTMKGVSVQKHSSKTFSELRNNIESIGVQQPYVEVKGDKYFAVGRITFENKFGSIKEVQYENVFRRSGDAFILIKTTFRPL